MSLIPLNTNPSRSQLLQFGVAWCVFFGGAAALAAWRGSPVLAWPLGALAIVVPLVGSVVPSVLRVLYVALSVVTFPIGFAVSQVVLAAVYFLVLTPIGLVLRWLKPGFFSSAPEKSLSTYWRSRPEPRPAADYFKTY
jgi:hypothetical protein